MEINLLYDYPRCNRNTSERAMRITDEHRMIARRFDKDFFDGDRLTGYGGYNYNPRYWRDTTRNIVEYYQLDVGSRILDVGCAKGYMLYDMVDQYPYLEVYGIDISQYAIDNAKKEVADRLQLGSADDIPFPDKYFDLVISINTVHNLPIDRCIKSLQEIERVGKSAYITVDAWDDDESELRMKEWNLTALTMMSCDDWKDLFNEVGYSGDYFWFMP